MLRIPIRVQLGSLILLASLIGLAVISIAVWVTVHDFVLALRGGRLAMTAELKAAQLASNLSLMQSAVSFVSSRLLIQQALQRYLSTGNDTLANFGDSINDLGAALGGGSALGKELLVQAVVYPPNASGPAGSSPLFQVTGEEWLGQVLLPYQYPNGSFIPLGANDTNAGPYGYPPGLYPNLTYSEEQYNSTLNISTATYQGVTLTYNSTLFLGPWLVNDTFSLASVTTPIIANRDRLNILGWITILMDAALVTAVVDSSVGLGQTGECILVGPDSTSNKLTTTDAQEFYNNDSSAIEIKYVVPLPSNDSARHPDHTINSANLPFSAGQFPAINDALYAIRHNSSMLSGSNVYAVNEAADRVSIGWALVQLDFVDWVILVEYTRGEIWQPIVHVRNVILISLFSTVVFMIIVAYPLAHFASLPILRLREATRQSIEPPDGTSRSSLGSCGNTRYDSPAESPDEIAAQKEGFMPVITKWQRKRAQEAQWRRDTRRKRAFRIPGKVKERKTWVGDELSDLTYTFNEMSDELMMQYSKLEERVKQRTAELELSKKAAEAANESKTLFIANISHELKTPLNGILGMCAVCMQEDDPVRLKRSLGIIYKSGDLLLNLLTDLLTFSKNQVGQQLSLDEKEFRLRDISSQTMAIFDKQAKERQIALRVEFDGAQYLPEMEHSKRMRDMFLWGDLHRILQVVINLVSNSLKFTPSGGSVVLTIRCLAEPPAEFGGSRKPSMNSRTSRRPSLRFQGSDATGSHTQLDTANAINARDRPHALAYGSSHERAASPPPGKYHFFEFEVVDTGPGIPEELHHKIFEPFVQGDLGLTKKYGGTGLGLSICSQLAQLMGGHMSVRSTVGVGSTFMMKIPLRHLFSRADSTASSAVDLALDTTSIKAASFDDSNRASGRFGIGDFEDDVETPILRKTMPGSDVEPDAPANAPPRIVGLSQPYFAPTSPMESPRSQEAAMEQIVAEASRADRIRVLVAEDNKVNQEVVLRMLKLEDIYDVTVAKDGQEALDLVKASMHDPDRRPFNLIFMDVQMPNVDGLQSTRLIREIGYQAPIVALTAFTEESNIKDCLDSGMNYFLSKPIRRPQLKKVLKEYCAPIPEENEDASPAETMDRPGPAGVGPANTTIVMVNKSDPSAAEGSKGPGQIRTEITERPGIESPEVSPHTAHRK